MAMATRAATSVRSTVAGGNLMSRLLQARTKHTASQSDAFISVEEHTKLIQDLTASHEKDMSDLSLRMDESLLANKVRMDKDITLLRHDLKKEAGDKSVKHCIDRANIMNEFKALEEQFRAHKLATECALGEGQFSRLKNMTLGFIAVTVVLSVLHLYQNWSVIH